MAKPRSSARTWVVVGAIALLFLILIAWHGPTSPEGRYTASSSIGIEGDFFWELSNGKMELVSEGDRSYFGRYVKTNGAWFWIDDRPKLKKVYTFRIDSTWWRLRMVDDATREGFTWGVRRLRGLRTNDLNELRN